MSRGGVDQYIHLRKGKAVFGTCFVQVGEVNAHSPFAVCFLHQHNIHQLGGIIDFSNETSLQELLYFFYIA
jgi:hypothetical protein